MVGVDQEDEDSASECSDTEASTANEGTGAEDMEEDAAWGGSEEEGKDADGAVGDAAADEQEAAAEQERPATQAELEEQRQQNIQALVSGTGLALKRAALMPRLGLTVQQAAVLLRRPFKSPHPDAPPVSDALKRKLAVRKVFVPWGGGAFVPLKLKVPLKEPLLLPGDAEGLSGAAPPPPPPAVMLPPGVEPLVLWEPPAGAEGEPVRVDDMLTQFLRPHQREGVQFMFECVTGLRSFEGQGCILADDMGLGKTLQGISLLWTLLSARGHALLGGAPVAKRVIICCPTSLVGNWDSECQKWLKGRVRTLPLCESSRDEALASISQFLSPRNPYQVMIVSYETFRIHAERFRVDGTCDLLICDEAHRLKNDATLTNRALDSLPCRRRVLLSGTPLQNRLDEFYAMVSFCNPGVLGSPAQFRRHFEAPILAGREPDASKDEVRLCHERTEELSALVNEFILRRTNTLLSEHLPPKVVEIVCCRLTPLQRSLYCHFLESKAAAALFATQKAARVLSAITSLRKLLNHPKLIWDALNSHSKDEGSGKEAAGFEGCASFFLQGTFGTGRTGRGSMPTGWELLSGKFAVLAGMLELLRSCTRDRIVIVSNYTQTLDLVSQLCRDRGYPFVRLDGTTSIKKRNKLVQDFNDASQTQFAFLLSSKAGGCGLNLIGGNRLVLFDPSWNPADDKQAAARVWRDGQSKRVYVYRFMAAGSIEEKVYQRQLSKEGLQQVVDSKAGGKAGPNLMSINELRDLFSYDPDTLSTTYDSMCCERPPAPEPAVIGNKGGGSKAGKAGGGKVVAAAGGNGGGGGRKRRRQVHEWHGWSSSEEEEEESDAEGSEWEQREQQAPGGGGESKAAGGCGGSKGEIVISDTEKEEAGPRQAVQHQHQQACRGVTEDSEGWSSGEGGGGDAAIAPAGQGKGQGLTQPLPVAQQEKGEEQAPPGVRGAGEGGVPPPPQQQERRLLVPTRQVKELGITIHNEQVGKPGEEQLRLWAHHSTTATVPDQVLRRIGNEYVSFVFSLEVDGRAVGPEPPLEPLPQAAQQAQHSSRQRRPLLSAGGGLRLAAPAVSGMAAGDMRPAGGAPAGAAAAAALPSARCQAQAPASVPAPVEQQQQEQRGPAATAGTKENAAINAAPAPGSKLALPRPRPANIAAAAGGAGFKRPQGLAAAVQHVMHAISDSDDDFK